MDSKLLDVLHTLAMSADRAMDEARRWQGEAEAYKHSVETLNGEITRLKAENKRIMGSNDNGK